MTQCIAEPISRKELRDNAELIRFMDGSDDEMFFDIVHFLEIGLYQIDPTFNFRVLPKEEMGKCHGLTFMEKQKNVVD